MPDIKVNCIVNCNIKLSEPTKEIFLSTPLAYNNTLAHAMRVTVYNDDGTEADLTGVGVTGVFLRADDNAVDPINGDIVESASGVNNIAEIILPASCYIVPGRFTFSMNLTAGNATRTALWVEGHVKRNTSGTIIDPGTPVGNIEQAIGNANSAASAANAAAETATQAAAAAQEVADNVEGEVSDLKSALNNVENELFSSEELTLENRANLKRLNPTNGDWGSAQGYQIVAGAVTVGNTIRIYADDRWQFQTTNRDSGTRIGETYEAGTYTVEVPETALYVVLSTPNTSNAHVYLLSSKVDGFTEAIAETNRRVDNLDNAKMGKDELDPDGLSIDVSGVENGAWAGNVGDTISPRQSNNCRRIIIDLSDYVGYKMKCRADTTLNPQTTNGCMLALCDDNGIIVIQKYEAKWKNEIWEQTITAGATQLYLSYTYANTTNLAVNVISPKAEQFAKIPVLEEEIASAVKPISFTNLCENANIDDITGFGVNSTGTISAEDHVLTINQTGRNVECTYVLPTVSKEGHKYFFAVDLKSDYTGGGLTARLQMLRSGKTTISIGTKSYKGSDHGTWQRLIVSCETPISSEYAGGNMRLMIYCSAQSDFVPHYIRRIVIIDLTETFGSGNEPDAGTMDNLLKEYSTETDGFFEGELWTNLILSDTLGNGSNNLPLYVGVSGHVIEVNTKYSATQDIHYTLAKTGSNSIFNFRSPTFISNSGELVSPEVSLSQTVVMETDWFSPEKLKVPDTAADGDMPDSDNFTGGNHAYNGDSSGSPTGRTAEYSFYVDGRRVAEFRGYAHYVDVHWTNYIQATNTKKADGSGREVMKEMFHAHFDGEKWSVSAMFQPLEDLRSWSLYGMQCRRGALYNGYVFYHDSPNNRMLNDGSASSNCGGQTCRTVTIYKGTDYMEIHIEPDGLGDLSTTGTNSFFSSNDKTYSSLAADIQNIPANSIYTYKGYYKFFNRDFEVEI